MEKARLPCLSPPPDPSDSLLRQILMRKIIMLAWLLALFGCGKQDAGTRVEYTKEGGKKTSDINSVEDGTAKFQVVGKQTIPAKARQLHEKARAKGESGDYVSAIKLLNEAIAIAPDWAYPHYDMAFTCLLQGDSDEALSKYKDTDRLEPAGFFTTKTAVWSLEREEKGSLPKGTYLTYVSLEWADPGKKKETIDRMITNSPSFAPVWKEKALITEDSQQQLQYFDKALSLDPDPETYGMCMLNKAALLNKSGQKAEAQRILEELSRSQTSTVNTKALAAEFLKKFKK